VMDYLGSRKQFQFHTRQGSAVRILKDASKGLGPLKPKFL